MKKNVNRIKELWDRWERLIKVTLGAFALTAIVMSFDFDLLEAHLYDLRVSLGLQRAADSQIVLVTIDEATLRQLDEFAPLPLDFHAHFFEALEDYKPKAVGYLVDLNRVHQLNPEPFRTQVAMKMIESVHRLEARRIPVVFGTQYDVTGEVLPPYPLGGLSHSVSIIHRDGNVFSRDKVTRRALLTLNERRVFHSELAYRLGAFEDSDSVRGSFKNPEIEADYFFFEYHGDPAKQRYETVSFRDILSGQIHPKKLENKILLVGTLSKEDSSDFTLTPFSRTPFRTPKLSVHANILDSVLNNDGILRATLPVNTVITFLLIACVLWVVMKFTPGRGVVLTVALLTTFLILSHICFKGFHYWLQEGQAIVGIFLGYYLAVPYRLILEYKKRWDYQRKNEILLQVEELKTNFMSLVTHDLKTPVARIQGLAEVLLRKVQARLEDSEKETVRSIIHSTEELNHFISSILELNKVESNRIQMHLESRDINQMIERAVDGQKPSAKAREISIESDLEPLFPISVDPSLISKVLNNLIDNALKYSPPRSVIRVESREIDGFVRVSVTDQGIGMSEEELSQLFTRFYRAKNDTTTKITGTGLGLYLTKYFVEAHGGKVIVESTPGQGSTFQMLLPIKPIMVTGLTYRSIDGGNDYVSSSRSG